MVCGILSRGQAEIRSRGAAHGHAGDKALTNTVFYDIVKRYMKMKQIRHRTTAQPMLKYMLSKRDKGVQND